MVIISKPTVRCVILSQKIHCWNFFFVVQACLPLLGCKDTNILNIRSGLLVEVSHSDPSKISRKLVGETMFGRFSKYFDAFWNIHNIPKNIIYKKILYFRATVRVSVCLLFRDDPLCCCLLFSAHFPLLWICTDVCSTNVNNNKSLISDILKVLWRKQWFPQHNLCITWCPHCNQDTSPPLPTMHFH